MHSMRRIPALAVLTLLACNRPYPTTESPDPEYVEPEETVVAEPVAPARDLRSIAVCVLGAETGRPMEVAVDYDMITGDTIADGRPFGEVYPVDARYAASATWYINNEAITVGGHRYRKYGLPRVLGVYEIEPYAVLGTVPTFDEAGVTTSPAEVIYVPLRPGCEFQPYLLED